MCLSLSLSLFSFFCRVSFLSSSLIILSLFLFCPKVRKLPDTVRKPFRELTRFAVAQPPGYEAVGGRIGIEHLMAVVDPVLQQISGLEEEQRHFAEGAATSTSFITLFSDLFVAPRRLAHA